ncbi:MAG: hypothetical protein ABR898_04745 [Terracidiphilus sp.]|jgi:hypothetical protein
MNDPSEKGFSRDAAGGNGRGEAEATLRLIARLPAPEGLEERVRASLRAAPRRGRILAWPAAFRPESGWMRAAAAAAIVFVVAGGGWGVYSRVEQRQPARTVVLTPRVPAPGGFASAGAVRTPQTLNGPVVAHPATTQAEQSKVPAQPAEKPGRRARPAKGAKASAQLAAPPAR